MNALEPIQKKAERQSLETENAASMPGMKPPTFSLTAGTPAQDGGGKKKKKEEPTPQNPKKAFDGPVAAKGTGDSHAFAQDDIYQGSLGDCWVLASIAAIAKANPSLLEGLIQAKGEGKYAVTLYKREGENSKGALMPKTVTVTNVVPVDPKHGSPVYVGVGGDEGEIWPMLLENAYVKIFGERVYQNLDGGDPIDALEALTGKSAKSESIESKAITQKGLTKWHEKATKKFDKQNPGASAAEKEKFGPKLEHPLKSLREWEIVPMIDAIMKGGEAIVISTKDLKGKQKVKGFTLLGPHAYSVESVDIEKNTVSLVDPSGVAHVKDLPAAIIRTHFDAIDHVNVAPTTTAPETTSPEN
jgi:Calpain family cysteine protease